MNKLEYFIYSIKNKLHYDRRWLLGVTSLPMIRKAGLHMVPTLSPDGKSVMCLIDGEPVTISDALIDKPLYDTGESVKLPVGALPNITEPTNTTYRIAILNAVIITSSFGSKIPYLNVEKFSKQVLNDAVLPAFKDKTVTLQEYLNSMKAIGYINALADVCVPTTSIRALRSSPKVTELKKQLIEQYKDQLDDPVTVARIDKALVKLLKEEMVGDESEGFYVSDNQIAKIRKMTHAMMGGYTRLNDRSKVSTVTSSLHEGFKAEDIPTLINQARAGSYDRGKDTALGGNAAKLAARVYQNLRIIDGDCGSKVGFPVRMRRSLIDKYVGRYLVGPTKATGMTAADLKPLVGKTVYIRSPIACKTPNGNMCQICAGDNVVKLNIQPGPLHSQLGSRFLDISLKAFHGVELKTTRYDPMLVLKDD